MKSPLFTLNFQPFIKGLEVNIQYVGPSVLPWEESLPGRARPPAALGRDSGTICGLFKVPSLKSHAKASQLSICGELNVNHKSQTGENEACFHLLVLTVRRRPWRFPHRLQELHEVLYRTRPVDLVHASLMYETGGKRSRKTAPPLLEV